MQQQQQLQWSAACQWVLGWMGGGGGGEGGEGVCGRGSVGVRQLMVRAPAGHTGASRWRTSEPPHSSTKTLPTLAPCSCFQPKSLSLLSAFQLSLSLYHCLAPFSLLPLSFSFYSFLVQLIKILPTVAALWLCSLYLFSWGVCVLTYASFFALSLLKPLTSNVPRKHLVA